MTRPEREIREIRGIGVIRGIRGMRPAAALVALGAVLAGGCQGEGGPPERPAGGIEVGSPWVRPVEVSPGDTLPVNSAGYMVLRNGGATADRLVGVDFAGARRAEVHRSFMEGEVARMEPVDSLVIPAGDSVTLRPGGIHLMLMGVRETLSLGDTVALALRFRDSGTVEARAPVRHLPPGD